MSGKPEPSVQVPEGFDSLAAAEAMLWRRLEHALSDRGAPWRTPVLATVREDGAADARTLVLRAVDASARRLMVHSDSRAGKLRDIAAQPRATMVFYDPGAQLQARLHGIANVVDAEPLVKAAWARVPDAARRNYRGMLPPGAAQPGPMASLSGSGEVNFALIEVQVFEADLLWVGNAAHLRCRFRWPAHGDAEAAWVSP